MALDNLGAHTDGGTITEGQDDKEDTSNKLDNLLDNSQNGSDDFVVTAGGTHNLNTPAETGNFDWADQELARALLKDYAESVDTQPTSDGTIELDYQLGPVFDITLTQDTTFIFTFPPITGKAGAFTLIIRQDGPGGNTVTLPTVQWEGGTEPIWVTTGGNVDIVSFLTVKAGSPWYGFLGGLSFA